MSVDSYVRRSKATLTDAISAHIVACAWVCPNGRVCGAAVHPEENANLRSFLQAPGTICLVARSGLCCMKGATSVPAHSPWLGPLFDQGPGVRVALSSASRAWPAPRSQARRPTWEEGPAMDIQTKHEFWIIAVSTVPRWSRAPSRSPSSRSCWIFKVARRGRRRKIPRGRLSVLAAIR